MIFSYIARLLAVLALSLLSTQLAFAFSCRTATAQNITAGTANVFVNLTPQIQPGQNLVVDLSSSITCRNDSPQPGPIDTDYINLTPGTTYSGVLTGFTGSVYWNGSTYGLPMTTNSNVLTINNTNYAGLPMRLYLTATGAATGIAIAQGQLIASLRMYKIATFGNGNPQNFVWNIYANNNVVVPTGGCDVSARSVTVPLPDYPGTAAVPLTVRCAQNRNLSFFLSGATTNAARTIFANTASSSPAQGMGVQLLRGGNALATQNNISLGVVGTSAISLGLTANYARTTGQVTAGNVQSVIGVTFVYQ